MPISIGGLSPLTPSLPSSGGATPKPAGADFGSALKQAVGALGELSGKADASSLALAKGEPIDIPECLLTTHKARLASSMAPHAPTTLIHPHQKVLPIPLH